MYSLFIKRCISSSSGAIALPEVEVKRLVSEGLYEEALTFYKRHVHPFQSDTNTAFIIPSITKACAHSQTHQIFGLQIQCNVLTNGLDSESTVSNSIMSMYAKFSDTSSARKVFDEMPERDTISWNSMINCYTQNGFLLEALNMLREMYVHGFVPKPELLASCLSTCVKTENWKLGRAMHGLVFLDERIEKTVFISTALLDFYSRYADIDTALRVFYSMEEKNEVSWTAMISGCIEGRDYNRAFSCLRSMQFEDVKPNRVTLISILPASIEIGSIIHGKEIHSYAIRRGYDSDIRFSSALVHMYCEFGALKPAKLIFDRSVKKEVIMWSSIITGYSRTKDSAKEAIWLFRDMQMEGILPNSVTLLAVLSACTNLLSLRGGSAIHGYSLKLGLGSELFIQNSLINMYSKCGGLHDSIQVFNEMSNKDCISWSAIISAYGLYGYANEALKLFYEMRESEIKTDAVIYLAVLTACNHAGLVDEAQIIFYQALEDVNVSLTLEHYTCFIDLLGRAGKLEDACDVVSTMPFKPCPKIWSSLVHASKLHGRLDIAESMAQRLVRIEPENAANYALLSMIYAESGKWLDVEELRRYMMERRLTKKNRSFSKI
ncbi:hypothetical protein RD792_014481 [Penstemon davidsonii]|uniref:Pentatricopeptide repeat-containing protein n=1 Tax=Penstemon davidsonii TaxID=160366 RepID=A0ABR0CPL1_9LAMI|nr:hypothetical protein RD792_014481 [Penstemon davidsonii]